MCYHVEFGRSALKDVGGESPKLGSAGTLLCWGGRHTSLPDMCYHVKFGSSATKGGRIKRREYRKLGESWDPMPLEMGRG